jgi:hypothetical protein
VCDPAREKERHGRLRDIGWIEARHTKEVADMIECHDDHDDAA